MTATYENIATTTLGSNTASVTFSSISGLFTDLIAVLEITRSTGQDVMVVQVGNGSVDTGSNYSWRNVIGNGSSALSQSASNQTSMEFALLNATPNPVIVQFMNYSNTTTNKTVLARSNNTGATSRVGAYVGLWRSTSAINTITFTAAGSGLFLSGSIFTIYGIKAE